MSLTLLPDRKLSSVGVVRWLLDARVNISYAVGPLIELSMDDFRAKGWGLVRDHFQEFSRKRIAEREIVPVFRDGEERRFLRNRVAIRVRIERGSEITLIPQEVRGASLSTLESLEDDFHQRLTVDGSVEEFWAAFDGVLKSVLPE